MLVDLRRESSSAVRKQTLQLIRQALHAVWTTPLPRNLHVHQQGFVIKMNIFNLFCGGAYRFFFPPFYFQGSLLWACSIDTARPGSGLICVEEVIGGLKECCAMTFTTTPVRFKPNVKNQLFYLFSVQITQDELLGRGRLPWTWRTVMTGYKYIF